MIGKKKKEKVGSGITLTNNEKKKRYFEGN